MSTVPTKKQRLRKQSFYEPVIYSHLPPGGREEDEEDDEDFEFEDEVEGISEGDAAEEALPALLDGEDLEENGLDDEYAETIEWDAGEDEEEDEEAKGV